MTSDLAERPAMPAAWLRFAPPQHSDGTPVSPLSALPIGTFWEWLSSRLSVKGIVAWALLVAAAIGIGGLPVVALVIGVTIAAATFVHPPLAAYAMVGVAPFVIGFDRGEIIPFLRPNEGLLLFLWAVVIARGVMDGRKYRPRFTTIDLSLVAVAICASFLPLLLAIGRLKPVDSSDFMYSVTLWKLVALYALFRVVVKTSEQVRLALWILLATGAILGLLAAMDGMNILGTADRLALYFPVAEGPIDDGRGAATIGNAIGTGGYIVIAALVGMSMYVRGDRPRYLIGLGVLCCLIGTLGTGQFTAVLGLAVGGVAFALVTQSSWLLARWSIPVLLLLGLMMAPLIQQRVDGFESRLTSEDLRRIEELPAMNQPAAKREIDPGSSWDVRLNNLEHYFIPAFDEPSNIILGVTPQARVRAEEPFREWVWIESGYLWLIWSGGIPLVLAFVVFIMTASVSTWRIGRARYDAIGQAGAAAFASVVMLAAIQATDPHLTLRGTSDLFYPVLALAQTASIGRALLPSENSGDIS